MRSGRFDLDEHAALGVQPLQHAGNSFGGRGNRRARPRRRRGGHRSRPRQVIVDLPAHAIDLLIDLRRKLGVSCRPHLLRLVRQHRQRRLQAMRQIAGLGHRVRHAPLALVKQCVQLIDCRLYLRRISAGDSRLNAFVPTAARRLRS